MLSKIETRLVLSTLAKRRAWLLKASTDEGITPNARKEHLDSLTIIDSAIKKIASMAPNAPPKPKARLVNAAPRKITLDTARILVAEDNPDSAQFLTDVLNDFGLKQVVLATDGIEAFDSIKGASDPFDLILCDWDMPGLNGLEVHGRAKASNTLRGAHFIMVTAVSESARIREAIKQGVNDYIVKPVDIDSLEAKIRTALNIEDANSEQGEPSDGEKQTTENSDTTAQNAASQ